MMALKPNAVSPSQEWFDGCLSDDIPDELCALSQKICTVFQIKGICDPAYIANVAAFELKRGNGCAVFFEEYDPPTSEDMQRLAKRLSDSYRTSIDESESEETIIELIERVHLSGSSTLRMR